MQRLARSFLIVVILVLALDLFAALPAQAAQDALATGTWDLARYFSGTVAARVEASAGNLPLLLGAIVMLAALSSSSGSRKKDRW
jgi:hypothetical protein